jgi:DNA-binding CsgD family transcriptional regulator
LKASLTDREKEILMLILDDHSSLSIASGLRLSIRTVDTHRKNILRKTNCKSLVALLKFAIKADLVAGFQYKP